METPKPNSKPAKEHKKAAKRMTLNKLIASAPTRAKKWEIALHGGKPPTAIQRLPLEASGLATPSPHGPEWQTREISQLKHKFADLLLPALMNDDPKPFEELLEAMSHRRKTTVPWAEYARRQQQEGKAKPPKKEMGRRFRLVLLGLGPEDLLNIQTVKAALAKEEAAWAKYYNGSDYSYYCDDSAIYAAMKELGLRFLKPGDIARWICDGKVVRLLRIMPDGTCKIEGMTMETVRAYPLRACEVGSVVEP